MAPKPGAVKSTIKTIESEPEATKRQRLNGGRRFGTIESDQRRASTSRNKADKTSRLNIGKHIPFNRRLRASVFDLSTTGHQFANTKRFRPANPV